jgi:hypothetical protein
VSIGCDKKVEITFVNQTAEPLEIRLSGPGKGTGILGTVAPEGGTARTRIKVKKELLPAIYHYQAGEHEGRIGVNRHTKGKLWVILPGGLTVVPVEPEGEVDELYAYGAPAEDYVFTGIDVPTTLRYSTVYIGGSYCTWPRYSWYRRWSCRPHGRRYVHRGKGLHHGRRHFSGRVRLPKGGRHPGVVRSGPSVHRRSGSRGGRRMGGHGGRMRAGGRGRR